jgi:hypothetical protein
MIDMHVSCGTLRFEIHNLWAYIWTAIWWCLALSQRVHAMSVVKFFSVGM